jgi:hypothetical protein
LLWLQLSHLDVVRKAKFFEAKVLISRIEGGVDGLVIALHYDSPEGWVIIQYELWLENSS